MKNLLLLFVFISISGLAQKPTYDSILAKKLGADDYGMKHYVFCILKTGPVNITDKAKKDSLFAGHMRNIGRLADEGKLAVAGPFGKNDKNYRGIFIFNVATVEEAQKLVETDPALKAGIFIAELTPLYCTASLMEIPELHKKVQKKNF